MATSRNSLLRHVFVLCSDAGVKESSDRIELAKALLDLGEGITSFTELTVEDLEDLLFALKGWRTVQELRLANGTLHTEALLLIDQQAEIDREIEEHRANGERRRAELAALQEAERQDG